MGDRTIRRSYNPALMHEVLGRIEADPDSWAQHTWVAKVDFGTAMCFAGHALVAAGEWLFDGSNSLTRLHRIVEMLDARYAAKAGR